MKKSDRKLGMHKDLARRDFVQDSSPAVLGLSLPLTSRASSGATINPGADTYTHTHVAVDLAFRAVGELA